MNKITVYRELKTPDGTILYNDHSHDYKTHIDTITGETYMLSGGNNKYYNTSNNIIEGVILELYNTDPIEIIREKITRHSFNDKNEKTTKLMKDCSNLHIENILKHIKQVEDTIKPIFLNTIPQYKDMWKRELKYRKENNIFIKDK